MIERVLVEQADVLDFQLFYKTLFKSLAHPKFLLSLCTSQPEP
jgi:hypothetical protein